MLILSYKGGISALKQSAGLASLLISTYPEIGLDVSKFQYSPSMKSFNYKHLCSNNGFQDPIGKLRTTERNFLILLLQKKDLTH